MSADTRAALDKAIAYVETALRSGGVTAAIYANSYERGHRAGLQHALNAMRAEREAADQLAAPVPEGWQDVDGDNAEYVNRITAVVREADRTFEKVGGSSRHWVRDCFLPLLNRSGLFIHLAAPVGEQEKETGMSSVFGDRKKGFCKAVFAGSCRLPHTKAKAEAESLSLLKLEDR